MPFIPDEALPTESRPPFYYRLEILRGGKNWITSNQRIGYLARASVTKNWRTISAWRAKHDLSVREPIIRARVVMELRFCDKRRRDPANWSPTAKAVMDGLVDAGLFIDDDSEHVVGPDMRLGPTTTKGSEALIVHVWRLGH